MYMLYIKRCLISIYCILLVVIVSGFTNNIEFKKDKLSVEKSNGNVINYQIEIAESLEERKLGLMHREYMADNHGMLFIFPEKQRVSMWMKNTKIPLDILFIDNDGKILSIHKNAKPESLDIIDSIYSVSAALELKSGSVEKHTIIEGNKVLHSYFK